ncbi:MAG: biotin carboxylase N-terminal domain-containing protein [Xanthomonadales bacterium]|nr:biotin carboxylase N-terminal domain-containing protein [Xanthomonadales bacterium]
MLRRVLIANRGEIACRIIATCRRLGVETVAVYSDPDRDARHVRLADQAIGLGGARPGESYLVIDRIIEAARQAEADAIHPGYGFLAENGAFARACREAGITFIGPDPKTIELMGSKAVAKAAMDEAGVPLVPGYHGDDQDPKTLAKEAEQVGFPLMVKAAAGGGGKGMRIVRSAKAFERELAAAQREASNAFGDDRVILERYIEEPRHIEVQIFGDRHGNRVHLHERDCSSQRRYQKIIEEAPAPGISDDTRRAIQAAAVAAAEAVDYVNAGTVEFIVATDESFFFMEMNTRLQVEHPVTEEITGLDLVEWQLRVASGEPLPLRQEEIAASGHALEVRIYAEDPLRDFLPATGRIDWLAFPDDARADTGVSEGDEVTVHYDPMIAKLIVSGPDRQAALGAMERALARTVVGGLKTNLDFLSALLHHPRFLEGRMHTAFLDGNLDEVLGETAPPEEALLIAAIVALMAEEDASLDQQAHGPDPYSPWGLADGWRPGHLGKRVVSLQHGDQHHRLDAIGFGGTYVLSQGDEQTRVSAADYDGTRLSYLVGDRRRAATVLCRDAHIQVACGGRIISLVAEDPFAPEETEGASEDRIVAPMPGRIVALKAAPGDELAEADEAVVMEAMKMELSLPAPRAGKVAAVHVSEGEFVEADTVLIELEPAAESS